MNEAIQALWEQDRKRRFWRAAKLWFGCGLVAAIVGYWIGLFRPDDPYLPWFAGGVIVLAASRISGLI